MIKFRRSTNKNTKEQHGEVIVLEQHAAPNEELNNTLASVALACYLDEKSSPKVTIALAALAMYMQNHGKGSMKQTIAQVALALHLDCHPELMTSGTKSYRNVQNPTSAWNNKILMMRQLPIRR
ncbi:MAG: hypothetical protein GXX78_10680 [Bacteroidales bacterium]|nr:hypothetical protein [Bacteroidales bacterium]